jgi:putative transposase
VVVDTLGLILAVVVYAASTQDRDGARGVREKLKAGFPQLAVIWPDGGYAGALVAWVATTLGCVLRIVRRNPDQQGFAVLPKRWVVERTFGWFNRYRRLRKTTGARQRAARP